MTSSASEYRKADALWEKWENHYRKSAINPNRICKDGIVDIDEWTKCNPKILFVMKEVNDYEGGDLRSWLGSGPKYQMWHTIARWSWGLLHDFPSYPSVDNIECMKMAIKRIATINLKKTSGGSSSDMEVINAYARHDRDLLIEQIGTIKPEIIVAAGTFDSLVWILDLDLNPDNPYHKPCHDKKRNAWIIPWRHPARVSNEKTYQDLKLAYGHIQGRTS